MFSDLVWRSDLPHAKLFQSQDTSPCPHAQQTAKISLNPAGLQQQQDQQWKVLFLENREISYYKLSKVSLYAVEISLY